MCNNSYFRDYDNIRAHRVTHINRHFSNMDNMRAHGVTYTHFHVGQYESV